MYGTGVPTARYGSPIVARMHAGNSNFGERLPDAYCYARADPRLRKFLTLKRMDRPLVEFHAEHSGLRVLDRLQRRSRRTHRRPSQKRGARRVQRSLLRRRAVEQHRVRHVSHTQGANRAEGTGAAPHSILFVSHLPDDATEATLAQLFSRFPGFKLVRAWCYRMYERGRSPWS